MKPRTLVFGHPLHQILSVFPLGLLATSFFFDLGWLATGKAELAIVAQWLIFAGVLGGLIASISGIVDWLAIPRGTRAFRVGTWHGVATTLVTVLFAVSWFVRRDAPGHPEGLAIALSGTGVLLTVLTGWLGSELAEWMEEL